MRETTADRSWLTNFEEYAEKYLRIRAKTSELIPLKFNKAQQAIWKAIQRQMRQKRPVQVSILKSRQMGISTFGQGYVFWRTVTRPNTNSLVVAHDRESTQAIFEMARVMYEELPPYMRPMLRRRNKDELLFENPDERARPLRPGLRSKIEVRTAGNQEAGRGSTYHNLHLSEVSSWPEPELLATALFPTVPPIAGTAIILESTAKGGGTWWHDMYVRSKRGETGYDAVFVPWYWDPAYVLTPEETREWMSRGDLDSREAELVRLYGLSKKQLAFRRKAIASYPGGLDYFMQEFPSDDEEAWLGIGTPVFDREILRVMYEKAIEVKPLFVGGISPYGDLHEDGDGPLRIWEKPQKGADYVIGVDTAQGTEGGCDAAISVLMRGPSQKHVATWVSGKHNALQLVPFVEALAWMYNEALVSIEINAAGIATQEALSRTYSRCVSPETRVLTADLRWVRADRIDVGDILVGIDEYGSDVSPGHRYFRKSEVRDAWRLVSPRVRVRTTRGEIVVSADHRFLVYGAEPGKARRWRGMHRRAGWVEAKDLKPGEKVAFLIEPWSIPQTWEAGALYGYYQGEGSLYLNGRKRLGVSFAQNEGPALYEVEGLLWQLGFRPRVRNASGRRVSNLLIEGIGQALRFLGVIRPPRLLKKLELWWGKGAFPRSYAASWDEVVSVENLGEGDVIALETSTHTFIAEGYVAHNCFRWRFLDRRTPRPTERVGWQTTPTTKPLLMQHFNQILSKQLLETSDPELLRQAMGLAYADAARETVIEQPGVGSDIFMSVAIASYTDYLDAGYSRSERFEAIASRKFDDAKPGANWNPLEYDLLDPWEEVGRF